MIEQITTDAAFDAFSRSGIYTPPGEGAEPVEVDVIVDLAIEAFDQHGHFMGQIDTADLVAGQVQPQRGGTLSEVDGYDGIEWVIDGRQESDGFIEKWKVNRK